MPKRKMWSENFVVTLLHKRYAWFDSTPIVYSQFKRLTCSSSCCAIAIEAKGWADYRCQERRRAICEKNNNHYVTRFDYSQLADNVRYQKYFSASKKYYLIKSDMRLTFHAAQEYCRLFNATLVKVTSAEQANWVQSVFGNGKTYFLNAHTDRGNRFRSWSDGTPIRWTNWSPNGYETPYSCNAIVFGSDNLWSVDRCDVPHHVICRSNSQFGFVQKPRAIISSDQMLSFTAMGKEYLSTTEKLNHFDAVELCDRIHATPVVVATEAEHRLIVAHLNLESYWTNLVSFNSRSLNHNYRSPGMTTEIWKNWRSFNRTCSDFCCAVSIANDNFIQDEPCNVLHNVVCERLVDNFLYDHVTECNKQHFNIAPDVIPTYAIKTINEQSYLVVQYDCKEGQKPVSSRINQRNNIFLNNVCRDGRWYLSAEDVASVQCVSDRKISKLRQKVVNVTWIGIVEHFENVTIIQETRDVFRSEPITQPPSTAATTTVSPPTTAATSFTTTVPTTVTTTRTVTTTQPRTFSTVPPTTITTTARTIPTTPITSPTPKPTLKSSLSTDERSNLALTNPMTMMVLLLTIAIIAVAIAITVKAVLDHRQKKPLDIELRAGRATRRPSEQVTRRPCQALYSNASVDARLERTRPQDGFNYEYFEANDMYVYMAPGVYESIIIDDYDDASYRAQ